MITSVIPVFIINLEKRIDRRENVLKEFEGRPEFLPQIIEPVHHINAAKSLWLTIRLIIENNLETNNDFILLCEDDHQFTQHYSDELLFKCISDAKNLNCDLLSGGVSCVKSTFQITDDLYWMEDFTGLQFTVLFRKFFQTIIDFDFLEGNCADIVIANITNHKLLVYPFISTQKEFGYSDVTSTNNTLNYVHELFIKSEERVQNLKRVAAFYDCMGTDAIGNTDFDDIYIPTYILHRQGNNVLLENLNKQFGGRTEFDIKIIERASEAEEPAQIKTIIKKAIYNDDDIIIIAEDRIRFTAAYSKSMFIKNILHAHQQGAGLLLGSINGFDSAVAISPDWFWITSFTTSNFIVVFKKMFNTILIEPFNQIPSEDHILSSLTSHKIVMFPFITESIADFLPNHVSFLNHVFKRLETINSAYYHF